ncbi:MAG: hypothetical protein KDI15_06195 [Thiothrix sp.]|nr:hypothetical protein [Thiothrix sp.]HPE60380.1 hypothetical protein [Thiolinea sp.]
MTDWIRKLAGWGIVLAGLQSTTLQALAVFPGAQGFGTQTRAGRGGPVCQVSNLNDQGPGSLRACVEQSGPRVVVFTIGGTIRLSRNLSITRPHISIYGQSAPGDGIMITGAPDLTDEPFTIATHDVLIQHVRFRAGAADVPSCCRDALTILGTESEQPPWEISGRRTYNVVLDHCSFSWGTDEILSTWYDVHDITISNSIIGPSLFNGSNQGGPGSRGVLFGSRGSRSISFHHNLVVHSRERNPAIETGEGGVVDVVNNLFYNWGFNGAEIMGEYGQVKVNLVANLYLGGRDSNRANPEIIARYNRRGYRLHLSGNRRVQDALRPERLPIRPRFEGRAVRHWQQPNRFPAPAVTTVDAGQLPRLLLPQVGASLPRRDRVDRQVIADVLNRGGRIPNCVSSTDKGWEHGCRNHAGGWPRYAAGTPAPDRDRDGVPDAVEPALGLNPAVADAHRKTDAQGYTLLERWLQGL